MREHDRSGLQLGTRIIAGQLKEVPGLTRTDQKGRAEIRNRPKFECNLGYYCKSSVAADIELVHIVSGHILCYAPSGLACSTVSMNEIHADYIIPRRAESQAKRPAGVTRYYCSKR